MTQRIRTTRGASRRAAAALALFAAAGWFVPVAGAHGEGHRLTVAEAKATIVHAEAIYWHGYHVTTRVVACRRQRLGAVRCLVGATGRFLTVNGRPSSTTTTFFSYDYVHLSREHVVVAYGPAGA